MKILHGTMVPCYEGSLRRGGVGKARSLFFNRELFVYLQLSSPRFFPVLVVFQTSYCETCFLERIVCTHFDFISLGFAVLNDLPFQTPPRHAALRQPSRALTLGSVGIIRSFSF
ncbi:hypothetical protein Mal48_42560 [Thalassoglobus polymorphus]|uniref:Uncharacterized protein n=1 Tax=Thalassoglobus polymorphus TaxID=2527994 RepID=A0A517QTM4_9PLAN|nr:hypothetical protein Mal48_42560 [Thalassoglobus polymorphus]